MAFEKYVTADRASKAVVALADLGVPMNVAASNVLNALRVAGVNVAFEEE